jgi:hypothetical protein
MQQVGERRGGHLQDLGGGLLRHGLAQGLFSGYSHSSEK